MMVVVADEAVGDAAHDMPICNITNTSDISKLPKLKYEYSPVPIPAGDFNPRQRKGFLSEFYINIIVILTGKKILYGSLENENVYGGKSGLRIGAEVTVRQLKDIASCQYNLVHRKKKGYSPLNLFDLVIRLDRENKIPLNYQQNYTLNDLGIEFQTLDPFYIECVDHSEDFTTEIIEKEPHVDNMIELQLKNFCFNPTQHEISFFVQKTTRVSELFDSFNDLHKYCPHEHDSLELCSGDIKICASDNNRTMEEMGFDFTKFIIYPLTISKGLLKPSQFYSDNLNYIEFHSKEVAPRNYIGSERYSLRLAPLSSAESSAENCEPEVKPENIYVGLVNQAMTCYLNSLLQALYMTPEFRNALYNWEYIDGSEKDESNSIPYQLQKLFLNLQTSTKNAVETTALTKSFGWDSTEAWQQHDIQELCRVMLDSLEQKFKNTEQADLINRLYEGKMIDYVKCLECKMEKSREDTFLDIPLPVKPFGSNVAYNSVEEALRAFVQPETLEGVNQYFCETCNKKCNAHKGLKFTKFPYLLTLHLKRFDFDYNTFHRIKLNDKVTFPDTLNLNSFITSKDNQQESSLSEDDITTEIKVDENSTIDNGNIDDGLPSDNGISSSEATNSSSEQNDDDGIDVSHCPSTSSNHSQENDHNRTNNDYCIGPYQYELFSIMIHSGGAGGGHYYAYIKDFKTNEWLCFNDQSVSSITRDDIQKTYGGGPSRAYYNGAYSSSTNAYMLMYRQIDPERNTLPMSIEDFPVHIQEVLKKMKEQEKRNQKKNLNLHRIKVFCHHPVEKKLITGKIVASYDDVLSAITENAYAHFNLKGVVDFDQCRLVAYNSNNDVILHSLESFEGNIFGELLWQCNNIDSEKPTLSYDMLLEIKRKDEKFKIYLDTEITTKVFLVNIVTKKIEDGPIIVRINRDANFLDYKRVLSEHLNEYHWPMHVVLLKDSAEVTLLELDCDILQRVGFFNGCKVFIANKLDVNAAKPFNESALKQVAESFEHIILLNVQLPNTRSDILEELNIPSLENKSKEEVNFTASDSIEGAVNGEITLKIDKTDVVDGVVQKSSDDNSVGWNNLPTEGEENQEQSNSEDSSLSDSDKTLVGNASEDEGSCLAYVINKFVDIGSKILSFDINEDFFFQARHKTGDSLDFIQIFVDKRISFQLLKKYLEPYVKVPAEYFKIERSDIDDIYGQFKPSLKNFKDGEKLVVKLGHALRDNEITVGLYHVSFDPLKTEFTREYICDWVVSKDATVLQTKMDISRELNKNHLLRTRFDKFRLRKTKNEAPWIVLHNHQKIGEVNLKPHDELIIQELTTDEIITDPNQILILTKTIQEECGVYEEIVLNNPSIEELREKLVKLAKAPVEEIEVKKGLWAEIDFDDRTKWIPATEDEWRITLEDGAVINYRLKNEVTHDIPTLLDKNQPSWRKPRRYASNHTRRVPSSDHPRRERALKIYVDNK